MFPQGMSAQEKARLVIEQELFRMKQPRDERDYCPCEYCKQRREYKRMGQAQRRVADVAAFNPNGF